MVVFPRFGLPVKCRLFVPYFLPIAHPRKLMTFANSLRLLAPLSDENIRVRLRKIKASRFFIESFFHLFSLSRSSACRRLLGFAVFFFPAVPILSLRCRSCDQVMTDFFSWRCLSIARGLNPTFSRPFQKTLELRNTLSFASSVSSLRSTLVSFIFLFPCQSFPFYMSAASPLAGVLT